MSEQRTLRLSLAAEAGVLRTVRRELSRLLASLEIDPMAASDIQLAVIEACTNVVRHAYTSPPGALDVEAETTRNAIIVTVSDRGVGIAPDLERPAHWDGLGLGLGLPLIAALAEKVEIDTKRGRGTTIRLTFEPVRRRANTR